MQVELIFKTHAVKEFLVIFSPILKVYTSHFKTGYLTLFFVVIETLTYFQV
jgi:hypothetical protein